MTGRNILEMLLNAVEDESEESLLDLLQGEPGGLQISLDCVNRITPLTEEQFQLLILEAPSQMLH